MRKHKISAFVLAQNVEDVIEDCLKSITWVDEIFVVDAFSTDRTVEICKNYPNVKIVQHEYVNSGAQRTWGMPQTAHEWILYIDSDERCTPALREEIEKILSMDAIPYDGFQVHIRTRFFDRLLKHKTYLGYRGKRVIRRELYKTYVMKRVHAGMVSKNLAWIKNKNAYLEHDPIRDFKAQWQKMIRYAIWASEDMYEKGLTVKWYHFTVRPFFKFFQFYVLRGGFKDGVPGLILCLQGAIFIFMKYYKLMEFWYKNEPRSKKQKAYQD